MTDIRGGLPQRAFEGLRRWRRRGKATACRRRAIAELDALDDRSLQDIGVDRRSIPELVDAQLQAEAEAAESRPARLAPARLAPARPAPARPGLGARPGLDARPCAQPC